jgi:hypothetical protein
MNTMFAKTALGLAIILATASGALATTMTNRNDPSGIVYSNVYNPAGDCISTDPDFNLRSGVNRDWGRAAD